MDDILANLASILGTSAGASLSIATNATGEVPVTTVNALLSQATGAGITATPNPTILSQLGIQSALIVRDDSGNILWQSGAIPAFNPAYAIAGIAGVAFILWLVFRGLRR